MMVRVRRSQASLSEWASMAAHGPEDAMPWWEDVDQLMVSQARSQFIVVAPGPCIAYYFNFGRTAILLNLLAAGMAILVRLGGICVRVQEFLLGQVNGKILVQMG